jgi:hypothetical protein
LGVIAGLALLFVASGASADDTHYRDVPIGAHAIGLGGAFTGVADDASAAFFNPGGLALGGTLGLAAGLTINAWDRLDLERALDQPDGTATATTKTGRTVPIFIGAVLKFGPKDAWDQKRFALALSVVEPISGTGGVFLKFRADPVELTDTYKANETDRATWYGISFASRLDLKQSIGASLYLSVRKLNHSETGITLAGGMPLPDGSGEFVGTSTAVNTQSLSFKTFHFVLRFGWLSRLKPQLQLGIMLQPPGIPLKQTVDTLSQGFLNDNSDPTMPTRTFPYFSDGKVKANLPLPAEIEAGLEYWPAEKVMLAFDASFHGPVRSGTRVETGVTDPVGGVFFDDDTARRPIGNVALAGDFYISRKVMIEAGFFTDLSSAKNIPANPDRYQLPQINRFGGTLSFGLHIAGVSLAVGSTVIYGKGDATGIVLDLANFAVDYTRTQATSRTVFLHLTGATQAAVDLGDKTARGIKKYRRRKETEADEEGAGADEEPSLDSEESS